MFLTSPCSCCLCDRLLVDNFSFSQFISLFSILAFFTCSLNLFTSASNNSSFRDLPLFISNLAAKPSVSSLNYPFDSFIMCFLPTQVGTKGREMLSTRSSKRNKLTGYLQFGKQAK
ncbi:hypothetical protein LXL04_034052 [Taraxacum kok-saghyz]